MPDAPPHRAASRLTTLAGPTADAPNGGATIGWRTSSSHSPMLELGLKVFISYLIGSLNGSLTVGRITGAADIRTVGSGNAGGTNALRTHGKLFAFWVMVIDVAKGSLPTWLLPGLALPGVGIDPGISREWLTYACGAAAIVGHCYPVWFGFAGGKGAATAIGVLAVISPVLLIPATASWFLVLFITGYVGLATMAAGLSVPAYVAVTGTPAELNLFIFSSALAVFIIYTHRANIERNMKGEEEHDMRFSLIRRLR